MGGLEGKQEKGIFKDWKITSPYVISFEPTKQIHLIFNREVAKVTKKADDIYASALYDWLMRSNLLKNNMRHSLAMSYNCHSIHLLQLGWHFSKSLHPFC